MIDVRDPRLIPELTIETLIRYAFEGVPTGGFLESVLSGDLFGAAARADYENARALVAICGFVYSYLPSGCFGSPAAVEQWLAKVHDRNNPELVDFRIALEEMRSRVEAQLEIGAS